MTAPQLRRLLSRITTYRLSESTASLLAILHASGETTMTDAANALSTSSANFTGLADRLETLGYAKRIYSKIDRRKVILAITPRGVLALEDILNAAASSLLTGH